MRTLGRLTVAIHMLFGLATTGCTFTLLPVAEESHLNLSETHIYTDFGFSIDYPEGWSSGRSGPSSVICELNEDKILWLASGSSSSYCVEHDHRSMSFMRGIGLVEDPTLDDLLQLNSEFFDYQDPEVSETTVFGVPALQVQTVDSEGPTIALMGFLNEEAFLLSVSAPTEEKLIEVLPIWENMLASIRPVDEE